MQNCTIFKVGRSIKNFRNADNLAVQFSYREPAYRFLSENYLLGYSEKIDKLNTFL